MPQKNPTELDTRLWKYLLLCLSKSLRLTSQIPSKELVSCHGATTVDISIPETKRQRAGSALDMRHPSSRASCHLGAEGPHKSSSMGPNNAAVWFSAQLPSAQGQRLVLLCCAAMPLLPESSEYSSDE
ncbi:unnamed protein product [Linum tenue]|uniref:Uncharacterized protein n=1 Tax=Linum tenue TaxID=586396 RepID=A0AAV0HFB6_9ROSI|nr:unnamed protein product [Linum tenue]